MERVPREKKTHNVDLTVPINAKLIMSNDKDEHGVSCFTHLWDMTHEKCIMCGDNEMCGIMFHKRQKKAVKAMEESMNAVMDLVDFDGINTNELLLWLKAKPRRTGELVEKVALMSKCAEEETVRYWVRSFIKDNPRLSVKDKIVIVN